MVVTIWPLRNVKKSFGLGPSIIYVRRNTCQIMPSHLSLDAAYLQDHYDAFWFFKDLTYIIKRDLSVT